MRKLAIVLFVVATALSACGKKKAANNPTPPAEGSGSAEAGGGSADGSAGGGSGSAM